MRRRKIVVPMVLATALLLALASSVSVQAAEVVWEYEGDYDDEIEVTVEATTKANPGDEITVTIEGEAKEDLEDVQMDVWVEGSKEEGTELWELDEEEVLSEDLDDGDDFDEEYEFDIPETADPGMIVGHVRCEWDVEVDTDVYEWVTHSFDVAFPMTYLLGAITEEEFEELQEDYADLQAVYTEAISELDKWKNDYNSLMDDYDSLKATYDGLKSSYDSLKYEHDTLVSDHSTLQKKYTSLDSDYKSLLADRDALESEYEMSVGELGTSRNLMYVFVATTLAFIATSIILFVRKPKTA